MIRTKTFGKHIEDGLTFLGNGIHNAVKEQKDHELESIKLGLISDAEKLRMLKQELYRAAIARANPEHVANLRSAIATLSTQLENERTYRNSLGYQLTGIINSIILLIILSVGFSFPATWVCGSTQSPACQVSRIVPTATQRFFSDLK